MADLTKVMDLNPSSIYAAFGDKKSLFELAAKRYAEGPAQYQARALSEPTLREVILALFRNTVEFLTESGHPLGCMTLTGAMACSVEAHSAKEFMTEIRKQNEAGLKARLQQARKSGELAADLNVDDYSRYLSTLLGGLAIQAATLALQGMTCPTCPVTIKKALMKEQGVASVPFVTRRKNLLCFSTMRRQHRMPS
jgi:AcrR family transcriptional regulator